MMRLEDVAHRELEPLRQSNVSMIYVEAFNR